jgi:hypothetical protein
MAIDPENTSDLYLSIPTKDGKYNKDGIYELWRYTIGDDGKVAASEQLTSNSPKNNVRPFIIPGSKNSPLRLSWMQGDYYYWMVNKNYPLGFPTSIICDYQWQEELTPEASDDESPRVDCICLDAGKTVTMAFELDANNYEGTLFTINHYSETDGGLVYGINSANQRPQLSVNGTVYQSQNRLLTSDEWANGSNGTNGDSHPTKLKYLIVTLTYDGKQLIVYRNGLVDQAIDIENLPSGTVDTYGESDDQGNFKPFNHKCLWLQDYYACASPLTVQEMAKQAYDAIRAQHNQNLPHELKNGNFEDAYAPMQGSGVSSDRAIYLPEGWTIDYTSRNENDLTALKQGDLYFSNFFASRPKPSTDSEQTYWVRQNWGTSTITLKQELLLPEGEYLLTADVWKSGRGGDAIVSAITQDGPTVAAPSLENKEAWQQVSFAFTSDGKASTTICLTAMHNYNGTEKIIGFDNVIITDQRTTGINTPAIKKDTQTVFDLSGRSRQRASASGVVIANGRKMLAK